MKKFILSAMAVAAFAIGGVAQADVIDSVGTTISRIFGVPYDPTPPGAPAVNTDAYGRRFYLGPNSERVYIEPHGQYVPYGAAGGYANGPADDRDGDGVANRYDRFPDDPRYR